MFDDAEKCYAMHITDILVTQLFCPKSFVIDLPLDIGKNEELE